VIATAQLMVVLDSRTTGFNVGHGPAEAPRPLHTWPSSTLWTGALHVRTLLTSQGLRSPVGTRTAISSR